MAPQVFLLIMHRLRTTHRVYGLAWYLKRSLNLRYIGVEFEEKKSLEEQCRIIINIPCVKSKFRGNFKVQCRFSITNVDASILQVRCIQAFGTATIHLSLSSGPSLPDGRIANMLNVALSLARSIHVTGMEVLSASRVKLHVTTNDAAKCHIDAISKGCQI
jgi:hypothetical protein